MIKKLKLSYILGTVIAIAQFAITFITDKSVFDIVGSIKENYITCKILLFFILLFFWIFICDAVVVKNKEKIKYLKYFFIYLVPALALLIIIWPGVWYGSDVYNFIELTGICGYLYYLNYLTSVFYILGYMIFPCTSGVIILQVFLFAFVSAYIIKNCYDIFKSKWVYLLYLPFLLFHTIFYVYYPNRPIMFGILYLLLVMYLVIDYKKRIEFSNKKLLFIAILTAILSVWRSESIYLILTIPILVFVLYKIKFNFKNIFKVMLVFIVSFLIVIYPQKQYEYGNKTDVPSSRNLPALIGPLSFMLSRWELSGDNIDEDLANIDKVCDVDLMKKYGSFRDTPVFWSEGGCLKNYNSEEYNKFMKSYINVIKNNFGYFLRTKIRTFASASGVFGETFTSYNLYSSEDDTLVGREDTKTLFSYKIRKSVLKVIEGRIDSNNSLSVYHKLTGNLLLPILFIGIIFIFSIFKRDLFWFLLTGMLIGHTTIVFISAPASYFMYYFNIYLSGWILGIYYLTDLIVKKRKIVK